jgi:hypothetical protein
MSETERVTDADLRVHHCLETVDLVPGDPDTTAFKRKARLHQALWRESKGLPMGSQPMRPKPGQPSRPLGSRIALEVARRTESNFLDERVRRAVRERLTDPQPHETLDEDRLYCDLLSSMPMCFNLFASLQGDLMAADRAIHVWWPDVPGRVVEVRFEWSPGRAIPGEYLENRSAFDVAFLLDLPGGGRGVLGVETKYHEHCRREKAPNDSRLSRYRKVAEASGAFLPGAVNAIVGTDLQQIWLDHLLALSMPQHPSGEWVWTGFALVHPASNPSYARAVRRYCPFLRSESTMRVNTIESLLSTDALPVDLAVAFKERYLW